ncbi:NDR1/HIN1-like protein 1 [Chenopodium quinoa]|uniref:NDR1/HIN1-like protein 1 n=1 Tax=Chenopodium quinoa TaxID=63459 RepID=UPI000B77DFAD|nr:NDR1/HIN1-like protein 1 [Chenopodium quinoa]
MSQIDIKSPKHCAKKGFNFNFLNKKLFKILSTLVFSILSFILLIWFILHPAKPQFIIQEIDVYQLNFSSPHILNSSIEITLEARNPNKRVGIYYDELQAYASYKGQQITLHTPIPPYYQGQQDSNLISASLVGNGLPVSPSLGYEVGRDHALGKMILVFKFDGRIRWKVASWVSGSYRINVNCVTILPLTPLNPTGFLSSKQGTQCSTDI